MGCDIQGIKTWFLSEILVQPERKKQKLSIWFDMQSLVLSFIKDSVAGVKNDILLLRLLIGLLYLFLNQYW